MKRRKLALMLSMLLTLGNGSVFATNMNNSNLLNSKAGKIQNLIDENYVQGYGNGDFGYKDNIKRSEMTKLIVYAGKQQELSEKLKNIKGYFKDVDIEYWANGEINAGTSVPTKLSGEYIIKGYPNGTFLPEENITYAELSKMLVVLCKSDLDHEMYEKADQSWPKQWISWADKLGLYEDVIQKKSDEIVTREDAFTMFYNALSIRKDLVEEEKEEQEEQKEEVITVTKTKKKHKSKDKSENEEKELEEKKEEILSELQSLEKELEEIESNIEKNAASMVSFRSLLNKKQDRLQELESEIKDLDDEEESEQIEELKSEKEKLESEIENIEEDISDLESENEKLEKEKNSKKKEISREKFNLKAKDIRKIETEDNTIYADVSKFDFNKSKNLFVIDVDIYGMNSIGESIIKDLVGSKTGLFSSILPSLGVESVKINGEYYVVDPNNDDFNVNELIKAALENYTENGFVEYSAIIKDSDEDDLEFESNFNVYFNFEEESLNNNPVQREFFTDEDILKGVEGIKEIKESVNNHIVNTIKNCNINGSSSKFGEYIFNEAGTNNNEYNEYIINFSETGKNKLICGTKGTGFATGVINFLTLGKMKYGNVPENLIEVKVIDVQNPSISTVIKRDELESIAKLKTIPLSTIKAFLPEGTKVSMITRLNILVGRKLQLEYRFDLEGSEKDYIKTQTISFTDTFLK